MFINYNIRPMKIEDLDEVMSIEDTSFIAPWKKEEFVNEFKSNQFANIFVVETNVDHTTKKIIGFYDYWVTFDSATIAQIAIDPAYQRQHLGSLLMEEIIKDARAKKVRTMTLEVRKNNEKAVKLYQKFGFKQTLVKEKYYSNGDDAIYMIKELN